MEIILIRHTSVDVPPGICYVLFSATKSIAFCAVCHDTSSNTALS